jgi:Xaa-Pro aminopeptidase
MPFRLYKLIGETTQEIFSLDAEYTRLRLTKSAEEIERIRIGARLTDLGVLALRDNLVPGLLDHQLADLVERAYIPFGGATHIHYFGITSMDFPHRGAPVQHTVGSKVNLGDVIVTEISAAFQGYPGQVLRTMTMSSKLSPLYNDLHAVADAAYDAIFETLGPGTTPEEIVDAARIIEDSGFTTLDDLVHGFVGGYLPPVLGSRSRPAGKLPELELKAGMTLVIQPNVTSLDHTAGVQTGQLVLITETGAESLHQVPRGPWVGTGT